MIALLGALTGLRAGYRYDCSIGRSPWGSGGKRLAFWVALLVVEVAGVPPVVRAVGPAVWVVVFGYVLAAGLVGPWVVEYYRRRMA